MENVIDGCKSFICSVSKPCKDCWNTTTKLCPQCLSQRAMSYRTNICWDCWSINKEKEDYHNSEKLKFYEYNRKKLNELNSDCESCGKKTPTEISKLCFACCKLKLKLKPKPPKIVVNLSDDTITTLVTQQLKTTFREIANSKNNETTHRTISSKVKRIVYNRDNGKCTLCNSTTNLEYDHVIPFSKGGSTTELNIQLLCRSCNRSKLNYIK